MEVVEGVTNRATSPLEDDTIGMWFECPECGTQEDYIQEVDSNFDEDDTVIYKADLTINDCVVAY